MEAVKLEKLIVKCDSCDFRQEESLENVGAWHNKECPNCGAIVIDDKDMQMLNTTIQAMKLVNTIAGNVEDGHSIRLSVDSAKLK